MNNVLTSFGSQTLCTLVAGLCLQHALHARVIRVDNNPGAGAEFADLHQAIEAAEPGDEIYLHGSRAEYGAIGDIRKQIKIYGPGMPGMGNHPDWQVNFESAKVHNGTFWAGSSGSVLVGLEIRGGLGFYEDISDILIERCRLHGMEVHNPVKKVTFRQCWIEGTRIWTREWTSEIVFMNNLMMVSELIRLEGGNLLAHNIIQVNGTAGNWINNGVMSHNIVLGAQPVGYDQSLAVFHNIFENAGLAPAGLSGNGNQIGVSPKVLFISPTGATADGKYQLAETSPARGAGLNGEDLGIFGGSTPWALSAIPALPRVYQVKAPAAVASHGGLTVEVKAMVRD